MNELQIFNYKDYDIRVIEIEGQPWWVLKDVCDTLGLSNPSRVADRLDEDERSNFKLGRQGEAIIINESGLYAVILRSDKEEAKPFRKWITSEVIPTIRKTGSYSLPNITITETYTLTKRETIKVMDIISNCSQYNLPYVLDLAKPYLSEEALRDIEKQKGEKILAIRSSNSVDDFLNQCDSEKLEFINFPVQNIYALYKAYCDENSIPPIEINEFLKQVSNKKRLTALIKTINDKIIWIFTTDEEKRKYLEQKMLEISAQYI